jgi:hypothetical protein
MYKLSLSQILIFTAVVWLAYFGITYILPPEEVFHVLNPTIISLAIVLVIVFSRGLFDIFKHVDFRTAVAEPAHLLIFGIILDWIGMIIRMGRWYFLNKHPIVSYDVEFWIYNFGVWMSVWAGLFLFGAASIAVRPFKLSTLVVLFLVIFALLFYLIDVQNVPDWGGSRG